METLEYLIFYFFIPMLGVASESIFGEEAGGIDVHENHDNLQFGILIAGIVITVGTIAGVLVWISWWCCRANLDWETETDKASLWDSGVEV